MLAFKDWLAIIGISSLIATVVGHLLSKHREHEHWVYENRKQEWRELIDELHKVLYKMHSYHSRQRKDIIEDINEGMRILTSRLFIGETLEKKGIQKKWGQVIGNTFGLDESEKINDHEFLSRLIDFEHELISVAQNDLTLDRRK